MINHKRYATLILLLSPLVAGPGCPRFGVTTTDRSDFQRFRYEQSPALGFCPDLDVVYQATITRQPDGAYSLAMSIIEEGQVGVDECDDTLGVFTVECAVVTELPERTLTEAEEQEMLNTFSRVRFRTIVTENLCIDPCRVDVLRWDDFSTTVGYAGCGPAVIQILEGDDYTAITTMLEDFRESE